MLPPKKVVIPFLLRFVCLLTIYMIPWPGFGEAYGRAAGAIGNVLVGSAPVGRGAIVHFAPPSDSSGSSSETASAYDTELTARSTANGALVRVPIDLRTLAYVPTAVFVALAVAAPIWQGARGAIVLGAGLVLLQCFLAASVAVPLLLFFASPRPMQLVELSPLSQHALEIFYRSLVAPPGMAFAVPGFLWLFLIWVAPRPVAASN